MSSDYHSPRDIGKRPNGSSAVAASESRRAAVPGAGFCARIGGTEGERSTAEPVAMRARWSAREEVWMDALSLLKDDHDEVKQMFGEIESADIDERMDLIERLQSELTVHEAIEEEIFYPALRSHAEAKDLILEALEEHDVVNSIMSEILATLPSDETWMAKFTVMRENLEHHIEEEEGEMFDAAKDLMTKETLESLGDEMRVRKEDLQAA
jgi:hemerythrin superfamily protein